MTVEIIRQSQGFSRLSKEWSSLLSRSGANHLFLSPAFQEIWWRNFGRGDLQIVTLRKDDGLLVGLAPLMHDSGILSLIGGEEIADYLDFIVDQEEEEETYRQLWRVVASLKWSTLRLLPLPPNSPTIKYFSRFAGQKGWKYKTEVRRPAFAVLLPVNFEEYLNRLTGKNRHELRRKIRRLQETGPVALYLTDSADRLAQDLKVFFRLHRESSPDKAHFMDPKMESFFRELAHTFFNENKLSLAFLLLNNTPIAAKFSFIWEKELLLYNSGFDRNLSALSPGVVLTAYLIRDAIDKGFLKFDFMQGAERYKEDLVGQQSLTSTLEIAR
ncbi:MAG: GNAT family N-acetyltransferase [Patescibacteria group bacterium]